MSENNHNSGSLPNQVLNQLGEHTLGGFIMFYFNSETGEPEQVMNFDSPAHSLALQKYIADWSEAIHAVNIENSVFNIQHSLTEQAEFDEDEIDEDEE